MAQPGLGLERGPVEYTPAPASHLWVALCLGLGGAAFAAAIFLGLGEALFSVKRLVLEAIFLFES